MGGGGWRVEGKPGTWTGTGIVIGTWSGTWTGRVEGGGWRVGGGRWRVEGGGRRVEALGGYSWLWATLWENVLDSECIVNREKNCLSHHGQTNERTKLLRTKGRADIRTDEGTDKRTDKQTDKRTKRRDKRTDERTNGTNERTNGHTNGRKNGRMVLVVCTTCGERANGTCFWNSL